MVSILDLVPTPEIVRVRGNDVPVNGLSFEAFANLIGNFPAVAGFFTDGVNPAAFLAASPDLVAMVICAGIGDDGDKQRKAIKAYPAGDQIKLLNAVLKGTMPDGPGPFLELLATVEGFLPAVAEKRTKAPSTSSGKRQAA